ncbi:MAG: metalloregulator ArsR/SmtB family transcription factor [Acidobacteriota bacterium]
MQAEPHSKATAASQDASYPTSPLASPTDQERAHRSPRQQRQRWTHLFQALASESRCHILNLLDESERSARELTEILQVSQPTVSRHLTILRRSGLVTQVRDGHYVRYRIDHQALTDSLSSYLQHFQCCRWLQ